VTISYYVYKEIWQIYITQKEFVLDLRCAYFEVVLNCFEVIHHLLLFKDKNS